MASLPAAPKLPACSNCTTTIQPAAPGAPATQSPLQMLKSSDGKMRMDFPKMSVISNPLAQHAMLLDHVKQQVRVVPMQMQPPNPLAPAIPPPPHMPGLPQQPTMNVKDLGKATIEGHPVEGKQFTMHLPQPPKLPALPKAPALPSAPGMPKAPGLPQPPALPKPPVPTVAEVWTSQTTGMPVLSKITGEFGQHTTYCKTAPVAEPHPSAFQPPPHYAWVK